ncbi:MAG TPA: cyclic nucleotide-binding domain-containing protein, partial [Desulfosarcina sp.]|nr:cyclic nucleotide-binding domain-containing protein [Desulfosarcina sp.]
SKAVDPDHLRAFKVLYDTLNEEETNALYFAGERVVLEAGDVLFRQGDVNTRLFFIYRGRLKLTFSVAGKDTLIALLEAGDIAGQDSFLAATTCTTALAVQSLAELQVIHRDTVAAWKMTLPSLEAKLTEFCRSRDVGKIVVAKGLERRRSRRLKVEGLVAAQIVDDAKAPVGKPFRGEMADISGTGLSFTIKATDKSARLLLGRRLKIASSLEVGGKRQRLERLGITVAVTPLLFGDFAIHVKFDQPLKSA